jgi:hypothetical protein
MGESSQGISAEKHTVYHIGETHVSLRRNSSPVLVSNEKSIIVHPKIGLPEIVLFLLIIYRILTEKGIEIQ